MRSKQSYMDRALRHKDPRYARILSKMGYGTRHMVAQSVSVPDPDLDLENEDDTSAPAPVSDADALKALRDEYQQKTGKRPYHGWNADELRERIAQQTNRETDL